MAERLLGSALGTPALIAYVHPFRARAALLGSVSCALVRSAQSPLVVVPRGADGD